MLAIPDEAIRLVIVSHGGPQSLADKMIARKQQMATHRLRENDAPEASD